MYRRTLAIVGYSNSGKTTFLEQFIPYLKQQGYRPGFIKHTSHSHSFDTPGKDTARQFNAGAAFSSIYSDTHWSAEVQGIFDPDLLRLHTPVDIVLQEGGKFHEGPQIVCLHPTEGFPQWDASPRRKSKVLACLAPTPELARQFNTEFPAPRAFCRDDIEAIAAHVLPQWDRLLRSAHPLKGAVLIGGQSQRMKKDKAWLDYGKGPHALYLYEMLRDFSEIIQVCYSGEPRRAIPESLKAASVLPDRFLKMGPMGALLSLFTIEPDVAWLVTGCDLACLEESAIKTLLQHRDPFKAATVFVDEQGRYESVCAIYEPLMGLFLKRALFQQEYSLQKILAQLPIRQVPIPDDLRDQFFNANTPRDLEEAKKRNQESL